MRRTEVFTGLLLILVSFSYIASLLLDFKFVSPFSNPGEDLLYLSESINSQKISSIAWMATSVLTALSIPFYIKVFQKRLRIFHFICAIFMLAAAAGFTLMALNGFKLQTEMMSLSPGGLELGDETTRLSLLSRFQQEQLFRRLGSSGVAIWALGLSLSGFSVKRIPLSTSVLLFIAGPALLVFNWYDPEHVGRTAAMAGIIVGVMAFSVRLINKGLEASPSQH